MHTISLLDGFEIGELLFETREILIWHAKQIKLNRQVLLLALQPDIRLDVVCNTHLMTVVSHLTHIHTSLFPEVLDVLVKGSERYVVFEDANATNVLELLQRKPLEPFNLLQILRQLAEAFMPLQSAHLVHGRFSPEQLFYTDENTWIALDIFALRVSSDDPLYENKSESLVWCAPEQCSGEGAPLDAHTDMFSVGLSLYALATGQIPFGSLDEEMLYAAKMSETIPSPCDLVRHFPIGLATILMRMTQRHPEDRYATWEDLLVDLDRIERGELIEPCNSENALIALPMSNKSIFMWLLDRCCSIYMPLSHVTLVRCLFFAQILNFLLLIVVFIFLWIILL